MNKILILLITVASISAANLEVLTSKEHASDTIVIGVTGIVGEKLPITITERTYESDIKTNDKVINETVVLKKPMNEITITRKYNDHVYAIRVESDDLGYVYSYQIPSPFMGLPPMFPTNISSELAIFKIESLYRINGKFAPRLFLKLK